MRKIICVLGILFLSAGCQVGITPTPSPSPLPSPEAPLLATPSASPADMVQRSSTPAPSLPAAPDPTPLLSPSPLPGPSSTVTAQAARTACGEAHGQVESLTVTAASFDPVSVLVYLPPCYSAQAAKAYPVLYLLHGSNTDNTQWVDLGLPATADRLIQSGQASAFLVVMPRERNYLQDPNQSTYGNWITHALIPWVDQTYHTCAQRTCRAIGGLSRGGSWAFRVWLADWQDFSAIGMDSATPFSGDLSSSQAKFVQIPADRKPRFYLDIGKDDGSLMAAFSVAETFTRLKITYEWHLSDGGHNRAYWRAHVDDYLRWYTQAWN